MKKIKAKIIPHSYRDSVVLMELSRELLKQPAVNQAAAMMGTPANQEALRDAGLFVPEMEGAAADDLLIVVEASTSEDAEHALVIADELMGQRASARKTLQSLVPGKQASSAVPQMHTWREVPDEASVAVISIPGDYAASEAWQALRAGKHVVLFSNHVSLEDERDLKLAGKERGLLVLGAECGTAIINGVPLAFANKVRRGGIGIVAASGSGLQEVTCLIDRLGGGISHAIGTGGRDLSQTVGGLAMNAGIDLLLSDPATDVLVLLSKPPSHAVAERILNRITSTSKPVVICFLGAAASKIPIPPTLHSADTLEDLAIKAVELSGLPVNTQQLAQPMNPSTQLKGENRLLRGLFAGGTLAYEAMIILQDVLGPIYSNAPLNSSYNSGKELNLNQHICLDLGAEEYTVSVPHPMIDGRWRADLLAEAASDSRVGVVLFDVLLGTGSDRDPAGPLAVKIAEIQKASDTAGRALVFVCSITGTGEDIQGFEEQKIKLEKAGVLVAPSNAAAARLAASLIKQ